jgi:hypothetical protein
LRCPVATGELLPESGRFAKQGGARRFGGAFAPRTRVDLWFRNQVLRSLAVPGVARLLVGREVIDRLALSEYPLASAQS